MNEIIRAPKLRFPQFTDAWEQRKLGDVLRVDTRRNGDTFAREDVLSVSDEFGCVNQIRFQGRSFAGEDISNYKIVDAGDIIYTRSPLQAKPYGIIKVVRDETGIVSPLYIVNKATEGNDAEFIYRVFDLPYKTNNYLSPLVRKGAKNTMNISEDEWLSGDIVVSPNYEEQKIIGVFFKHLDNLITLHQRKIDWIKAFKSGMLQKMFPRDGALIPEIRFPGFTDAWEQRKLSELTDYSNGTGHEEYVVAQGKYELITLKSINSEGELVSSEKYVDEEFETLKQGTLIMMLSEQAKGMLGMTTIIPCNDRYVLNQRVAALNLHDKIDAFFLTKAINNKQAYFEQMGAGTKVQNISKGHVENCLIDIPCYEEQQRIGEYFNNLDNLITLHQRELEQLKEYKSGLLQQMFV